KTLLKQSYENFNAPSTESLDSIFNRLPKIVSQLAILGENISQEDLNLKFLRSQKNCTDSTLDSTANLSDTTVYAFLANQPNRSQLVHEDLEQIHEDDLEEMDLKWQLALVSMRAKKYYQRTGKKITINGSDTTGYDKSKVECFNCHKMGHFSRECRGPRNQESRPRNQDSSRRIVNVEDTSSKAMVAIDGAALKTQLDNLRVEFNKSEFNLATYKRGLASVEEQLVFNKKNERNKLKKEKEYNQIKIDKFENASKCLEKLIRSQISYNSIKGVGYNDVPPPPTGLFAPSVIDLSYSGLEEFQQPELQGDGPKASKSVCVDTSNKVKKTYDTPLVEELVLEKEKQTIFPKQQDKTARKPVKYAEMYISQKPRGNQRNWNNLKSQQLGSDFVMYNKACFVCGSFDHIQAHCKYHQRERMVYGNNYNRVNYNYTTNMTHPNAQRNMVPRAVLMKTGLKSFNTARTVNTARPNSAVVNIVRANQANAIKASACWVWRPTKLDSASITLKKHNYIDARGRSKSISRSLMEEMLPLVEESEEEKSLSLVNYSQNESLTCLVAKARLDESMLWHRRLGHVNFKTINKLVKDNLVRVWTCLGGPNDETSGILKNFITEIENLADKKVKIIRCDNGTEFKNRVMNEFCKRKGIKRDYSVARTP
ncbi:ribonuclease H-like domain-containing protein, partial [Tanacetum coccineum]